MELETKDSMTSTLDKALEACPDIKIKVRVVIPVKNNVEYTKGCLESLFKSVSDKIELEVIVVDNGSTDSTPVYLKSLEGRVRVIQNEDNRGFSGAVNQGLKLEPQEFAYALVLNNDTVVPRGLVDRMVHTFILQQDIGIVGPMSNFAGSRQGTGEQYELDKLDEFAEKFYKERESLLEVATVVGLCMMIRKKALLEIGYFDEETFKIGNFEDADLCLRARNVGWKCIVNSGLFIHHYGSKTFGAMGAASGKINFMVNRQKFNQKWNSIYKVGQKKRIVGMLRVMNGEPYITQCLDMAEKLCDEIVILVGSDSTDNTWNICKKREKVMLLEKSEPGYNEARDRNRLLEMAKTRGAQWCLCLDHDEIFEEKMIKKIQLLCNYPDPNIDGWIFKIHNFWSQDDSETNKTRTDGLWGNFYQCRLFRLRKKDYINDVSVHCGSHPSIPPESMAHAYIRIKHYGNMLKSERARKYKRYTEVDKNKNVAMILGGWYNHYCKVYGKDKLDDSDLYRHVIDETNIVLEDWIENNSVSLCMMTGNEKPWFQKFLNNKMFKLFCDEIVVVDNGSIDGTRDYLIQNGIKVIPCKKEWLDETGRLNNYSEPRNLSIQEATGRWVLRLDPDENIAPEKFINLFDMIQKQDVDAYLFPIKNVLDIKTDDWTLSETCRLFKNSPYIYYTGLIHEEIQDSLDILNTKVKPVVIARSSVEIMHFGYLRDIGERQPKYDHYAKLCQEQINQNPKDYKLMFSLAVHFYYMGDKKKAFSYYLKSLKVNPDWYMSLNDLGIMYLQRGNIDKAEMYFKRAIDVLDQDTSINVIYRDKLRRNYGNCLEYKRQLRRNFVM